MSDYDLKELGLVPLHPSEHIYAPDFPKTFTPDVPMPFQFEVRTDTNQIASSVQLFDVGMAVFNPNTFRRFEYSLSGANGVFSGDFLVTSDNNVDVLLYLRSKHEQTIHVSAVN